MGFNFDKSLPIHDEKQERLSMTFREINESFTRNIKTLLVLHSNPRMKILLEDDEKLGKLRNAIVNNLQFQYQEASKEGDEAIQKLHKGINSFISKMDESSNFPETIRRLEFSKLTTKPVIDTCAEEFIMDDKGEVVSFSQLQNEQKEIYKYETQSFYALDRDAQNKVYLEELNKIYIASGNPDNARFIYNVLPMLSDKQKQEIGMEDMDVRKIEKSFEKLTEKNKYNLEKYSEYKAKPEQIISEGDLLHGTDSKYFKEVLNNGLLPGDFLGAKTDFGDVTPMDVDVSKVKKSGDFIELKSLVGFGYGDGLKFIFDKNRDDFKYEFDYNNRSDHRHVRTGLPSIDIKCMLATNDFLKDKNKINNLKREMAKKGLFIPIAKADDGSLIDDGTDIFSPEEFNKMTAVYKDLRKMGYPNQVMDFVYHYSEAKLGDLPEGSQFQISQKHLDTIRKAIDFNKSIDQDYDKFEDKIDLVALVDFLKNNELNTHDSQWYQKNDIHNIMRSIQSATKDKRRQKTIEKVLFEENEFWRRAVEIQSDYLRLDQESNENYKQALYKTAGIALDIVYDPEKNEMVGVDKLLRLEESAKTISERNKMLLKNVWEKEYNKIKEDSPNSVPKDFEELVIPTLAGSIGRNEATLGSDADYLIIVNDDLIGDENKEKTIAELKEFINNFAEHNINPAVKALGIEPDAGLANADRKPFVLKSDLKSYQIELQEQLEGKLQDKEPTEIMDAIPLYEKDENLIEECKRHILVDNDSSKLFDDYILNDLTLDKPGRSGGIRKSYVHNFKKLYSSLAEGKTLEKVKESLQRTINFKLYHLMFSGFNKNKIPKQEAEKVPSDTIGKIELLKKYNILNDKEAKTFRTLNALAHKLRFIGDLYTEEAKDKTDTKKVKNTRYKVEDFDYEERKVLFENMKYFDRNILNKFVFEDKPESKIEIGKKIDKRKVFSIEEIIKSKEINDQLPIEHINQNNIKKIGEAMGSNQGGTYLISENNKQEKYYLKEAKDVSKERQIWNEVLADKLYEKIGFDVPETKMVQLESDKGRVIARAAKWIDDRQSFQANPEEFRKGFIADCYLANWDIPKNSDNAISVSGKIYRVDNGGALLYRAKGEKKEFTETVSEIDSMLSENESAYSGLTQFNVSQQIDNITSRLPDEKIIEITNSVVLSAADRDKLQKILIARRDYLENNKQEIIAKFPQ